MAQGYSTLNYGDQVVTLNGDFVSGLQGISLSTDAQEGPIKVLGYGILDVKKTAPITHSLGLEAVYHSGNQFLYYLTGESGHICLTGKIYQKDKYYEIKSGYCDNVTLSVKPNDLIRVSCNIRFYGDFISGSGSYTGADGTGAIVVPHYGSTTIILNNNFSGNCINEFTYTASLQKEPLFGIGNINPLYVQPALPTKHEIDIALDVTKDVSLVNFGQTLCNDYKEDIFLNINTKCDDSNIFNYYFSGCSLQSQTIGTTITSSRPKLNLKYVSYDWGHAIYSPDEYQCRTRITGYLPAKPIRFEPLDVRATYQILGYTERPNLPL